MNKANKSFKDTVNFLEYKNTSHCTNLTKRLFCKSSMFRLFASCSVLYVSRYISVAELGRWLWHS